jgi:tryptophanyl-tRNA synthetase
LDGVGKMSKSKGENTCIYLADDADSLRKKMMKAKTADSPTALNSLKPIEIQNLFDLMQLVSSAETNAFFHEKWNDTTIRYGDFKKQLGEDMGTYLAPIREKIEKLSANDKLLNEIINDGGSKARQNAAQTLKDVREIIGIKSY